MSYLTDLAEAIRREVAGDALPDGDTARLFRLYAVLGLAKGEQVTAEDVHDAWVAWMTERDPGHRSLRPFPELAPEVRQADEPYVDAIRAAVRKRG